MDKSKFDVETYHFDETHCSVTMSREFIEWVLANGKNWLGMIKDSPDISVNHSDIITTL